MLHRHPLLLAAVAGSAALWGLAAMFAVRPDWVNGRLFTLFAAAAVCGTIGCTIRGVLNHLYRRGSQLAESLAALNKGFLYALEYARQVPPAELRAGAGQRELRVIDGER